MASPFACAEVASAQSVDPVGSAPPNTGVLVVPYRLPWPNDIGEIPLFAELDATLRGTGIRLQAVVPVSHQDGSNHVVFFGSPKSAETGAGDAGAGDPLGEWRVPVLSDPASDSYDADVRDGAQLALRRRPADRVATSNTTVLVCTHGARDRCCGAAGTSLFLKAEHVDVGNADVHRVSHLGGHRFAPTVLVLPDATMWGFVDEQVLQRIVRKDEPVVNVMGHYRGSTHFAKGPAQVAESAVFSQVGWDWLSWRRSADVSAVNDGWVVRVSGQPPQSQSPVLDTHQWEVRVMVNREVEAPPCMSVDDSGPVPREREYRVTDVRRIQ